jgi:hypothetical protein
MDRYKITFITDWGAFIWKMVPFGIKNGLPTFGQFYENIFG